MLFEQYLDSFFINRGKSRKMNIIEELLITKLRDKNTTIAEFRLTANTVAHILAQEAFNHIDIESIDIETPLQGFVTGSCFKKETVLVPILRAGITLLPAFLHYFPQAKIAVVGCKRDEITKQPHIYYSNLPELNNQQQIIILDPMIATGGTAVATISILKDAGIKEEQILFANIISSPEGINAVKTQFPHIDILTVARDEYLTKDKFIFPGIGDFGDRFFGTK